MFVTLEGERGYFGMLAVEPAQQGVGLGRRMISLAEKRCTQKAVINRTTSLLRLPKTLEMVLHLPRAPGVS